MRVKLHCSVLLLGLAAVAATGCGSADPAGGGSQHDGGPQGGRSWGGGDGGFGGDERTRVAAVPVEVTGVDRRDISSFIETNGTLEAENEVDIVARASGPIVELQAEEGMEVTRGQTLARLDALDYRAQVEIARVDVNETRLAYERAQALQTEQLISSEEYEQAQAAYETARAQLGAARIQLGYTEIKAPFDGLIIARYVHLAEQVSVNSALFRISDFDPLLCPIQVPERELSLLHGGQSAHLMVDAWPGQRFDARVLRISPVVDAATGTIKVTLKVRSRGKLRPGMFARVFLQTETHRDALVIPKSALSLESIGDTVYVVDGSVASRREVTLGVTEGDFVEVLSGISETESVVVVGQDGLSDGTPVQILGPGGSAEQHGARMAGQRPGEPPGFDPAAMPAERLERIKQRMRDRGLSEEEIEERIRQFGGRPVGTGSGQPPAGAARPHATQGGSDTPAASPGRGGRPLDFSSLTPEQLEQLKQRMRARGLTEQQIEDRIDQLRRRSEADGQ